MKLRKRDKLEDVTADLDVTNPNRKSRVENLPTFSYSGKWKQNKREQEAVEKKKKARRSPTGRRAIVAGLERDAMSGYGEAGKAQGKQKSTGDTSKKVR